MSNKLSENKALKIVTSILYYILVILVLAILLVVILQRVSSNALSVGGIRIFNIISQSMVPKYDIGDILIAKVIDPSEIKIGDDVAYLGDTDSFKDKIVTHQVIQIEEENGEYLFHTKGIANEVEDPAPVKPSQIYGKIIYKTRVLSTISKVMNNIYGFYFLIFVPMTILIMIRIRDIVLSIRESREEDKKEKETKKQDNEE